MEAFTVKGEAVAESTAQNATIPHFNVSVPGHGLVEEAEALANEINAVSAEADLISLINPLRGYRQLKAIEKQRAELRPRLAKKLGEALSAMRTPVNGAPGFAGAAMFQSLSLGQSLAASLLLQMQWQRLVGTCDRKAAFLVAVASVYLSVVSLVLSVVFGVASL